jgi:hypothetical protein
VSVSRAPARPRAPSVHLTLLTTVLNGTVVKPSASDRGDVPWQCEPRLTGPQYIDRGLSVLHASPTR